MWFKMMDMACEEVFSYTYSYDTMIETLSVDFTLIRDCIRRFSKCQMLIIDGDRLSRNLPRRLRWYLRPVNVARRTKSQEDD